jgi:Cu+-exporting ATPase
MKVLQMGIEGMFCPNCSQTVSQALIVIHGAHNIEVLLSTNSAKVVYNEEETTVDILLEAVEACGFDTSVISNDTVPSPASNGDSGSGGGKRVMVVSIEGMFCPNCTDTVSNALSAIQGVISSEISLATNSARIEYDPSVVVDKNVILVAIEVCGFDVALSSDEEAIDTEVEDDAPKKKVLLVAVEAISELAIDMTAITNDLSSLPGVISVDAVGKHSLSKDSALSSSSSSSVTTSVWACVSKVSRCVGAPLVVCQRWLDGGELFLSNGGGAEVLGTLRVVFWQDVTLGCGVGARSLVTKIQQNNPQAMVSISSQGSFHHAMRNARIAKERMLSMKRNFMLALVLTVPLMLLCYMQQLPHISQDSLLKAEAVPGISNADLATFFLCTPVQFICGNTFHSKALVFFKTGEMGMDLMVSTGTMVAYMYSISTLIRVLAGGRPQDDYYFNTSAVLITVILLGKYLQVYAKGFTTSAISDLMTLRAQFARLVKAAPDSGWSNSFIFEETGGSGGTVKGPMHREKGDSEAQDDTDAVEMSNTRAGQAPPLPPPPPSAEQGECKIDVSLLQKGDLIRLVAGETIPADCDIVSGEIGVNESMLTGESAVVPKSSSGAHRVYSGTIVIEGSALASVVTYGDDSVLGQIVSTVQLTQESKPGVQEVADALARWFVPVVSLCSLTTFLVWAIAGVTVVPQDWWADRGYENSTVMALMFALSVWVSACPCAFGLATPTVILVATGLAAKYGVLIRKGSAIQNAAGISAVAFDKTGTLTMGRMEVSEFIEFDGSGGDASDSNNSRSSRYRTASASASADDATAAEPMMPIERVIQLLYEAERRSAHPLAKAITAFCLSKMDDQDKAGIKSNTGEEFSVELEPGQGLNLYANAVPSPTDTPVLQVGSSVFMTHCGVSTKSSIDVVKGMRATGRVAIHVATQGRLRAVIAVSDEVHPEAAEVIRILRDSGVKTYMLTGDQPLTAFAIGAAVGIPRDHILASCKPQDKEKFVQALQDKGEKVAFVGDGTNDANALARANVGVALGGGTDIAIDTGDIVLVRNDLSALLVGLDVCYRSYKRILFNYAWAVGYNLALLPIAAGVLFPTWQIQLKPMLAGGAMAFSSISIVLSSAALSLYTMPIAYQRARDLYDQGDAVTVDSVRESTFMSAAEARVSFASALALTDGIPSPSPQPPRLSVASTGSSSSSSSRPTSARMSWAAAAADPVQHHSPRPSSARLSNVSMASSLGGDSLNRDSVCSVLDRVGRKSFSPEAVAAAKKAERN